MATLFATSLRERAAGLPHAHSLSLLAYIAASRPTEFNTSRLNDRYMPKSDARFESMRNGSLTTKSQASLQAATMVYPDEVAWSHMKQSGVARSALRRGEKLKDEIERLLANIKRTPQLVRSFFQAPWCRPYYRGVSSYS